MKSFYVSLFLAALMSRPSLRMLAQTAGTATACENGYHGESWKRCPEHDAGGEPMLPCEQVNVCLPNCPEGYREARDFSYVRNSCVPAKPAASCSPVSLQLIWYRSMPVVWHWRAEISEQCAISRVKRPIHSAGDDVTEGKHGKPLGQFQVVVGQNGNVRDSILIWGNPSIDFKHLERPTALSRQTEETLSQLRFKPYIFRGHPIEFQTKITIPFKISKQ